jgi:hypothetical protein
MLPSSIAAGDETPAGPLIEKRPTTTAGARRETPPSRREDIPLLVGYFGREINGCWRLAVDWVTPQAMARLGDHTWPSDLEMQP